MANSPQPTLYPDGIVPDPNYTPHVIREHAILKYGGQKGPSNLPQKKYKKKETTK